MIRTPPAGELAGARDHRVGAFHRLDGDDGRRFHGDGLADVEAGDGVGDAVAELEIGALLVGGRALASARLRGRAAARETRSSRAASMPLSRSTSATPEMIASVFRAFSRISTPSSVRSGTMSAKSLVCLTCPAMTAWVTPASFRRLMHFPSWPSETQCSAAARRPRGRGLEVRKGFFLDGDDGDVVAGAAGGVEHQERKPAVARDQT